MKNELKVEHYDSSEATTKKKKILKIVSTGVGAAALSTMLGCFRLKKSKKTDTMPVKENLDTVPPVIDPINKFKKCPNGHYFPSDKEECPFCPTTDDVPMRTFICGGGGAWFNSVVEFLEA